MDRLANSQERDGPASGNDARSLDLFSCFQAIVKQSVKRLSAPQRRQNHRNTLQGFTTFYHCFITEEWQVKEVGKKPTYLAGDTLLR